MNRFTKEERSTFAYWFAHWCAFNMVALNCKAWKFRYLFHDWEKPWLRLFLPYSKVQNFHRTHSRHHLEYCGWRRKDYEGMIIDWECSRFTKEASPLTAREELDRLHMCYLISNSEYQNILTALNKLGL